jgi:RimJ/RimL family protein N-acetyltransferase
MSGKYYDLELGRIALAPVTPDTHQFLYYLATTRNGWRWRYRGVTPQYETFVNQLHADVLSHFVVLLKEPLERIGYVVAYSPDFRSQHAYYGTVFAEQHVGHGLGAEATLAFIQFVFATWPMRRIYTELPEFNADGMTERATSFLDLDATLRDYHFFAGRYWDQYIYSFSREAWAKRYEDELSQLTITGEPEINAVDTHSR